MRVTGQLYMIDEQARPIRIELHLDDAFRIASENGTPMGAMDPQLVNMKRLPGGRFIVEFAGRRFGFSADDPRVVAFKFLPELAKAQASGEPPMDALSMKAGDHSSANRLSGLLEGKRPVDAVERTAVSDLPPIGPSPADPPVPEAPAPHRDLHDDAADEGEPDESAADEPRGREPDATDPEPEPDSSDTNKKRGPPLVRLEPTLASRLGLPLKPLWKPKRSPRPRMVDVGGLRMAVRAEGRGRPVVMLGGGLGSMDVWSGVIPHISPSAQVISIDLVGFGESDRIANADVSYYDWDTHVAYLDACFDALGLEDDLTLVCHGWNSIVGLQWAQANETRVRALCYADAILRPLAWAEVNPWLRDAIKRARSGDADSYFLQGDRFIQEALEKFLGGPPHPDRVSSYRRAMGEPGPARLAHMAAIANIPVGGEPPRASQAMHACYEWLKETETPKLLILGRPGYLLVRRGRVLAGRLPHQTVATVDGTHLLPQSAPDAIGRFVRLWLESI